MVNVFNNAGYKKGGSILTDHVQIKNDLDDVG